MTNFYYQSRTYDLGSSKDRKSLGSKNSFCFSVASLAEKWFGSCNEFEFQTSGSTGKPKVIIHSREKLKRSALLTINYFKLTSNDRALLSLDPSRIAGAMMIVRAIIADMEIYAVDPDKLLDKEKPNFTPCTFAAFVPYQIRKILDDDRTGSSLQSFKSILVGGAPISYDLQNKISLLDIPIYETFGMTETVTHFAIRSLNGVNLSENFEVIGNLSIDLNERRCLQIKGDLTDGQTISTNDMVEILDHSHFLWIGRYDNVINSGGIKFSPEKIEQLIDPVINAFGITNRFIISSVKDESMGSKIVLVFEGEKVSNHIEIELMAAIKEKVEKYSEPKAIFYPGQFPVTSNGKVIRKEISSILAGLPHP